MGLTDVDTIRIKFNTLTKSHWPLPARVVGNGGMAVVVVGVVVEGVVVGVVGVVVGVVVEGVVEGVVGVVVGVVEGEEDACDESTTSFGSFMALVGSKTMCAIQPN